jgi:hypothetical protein
MVAFRRDLRIRCLRSMIRATVQKVKFWSTPEPLCNIFFWCYTTHFMLYALWYRNFNFLSHLSISFLSVNFRQYGVCGLFRFPFGFILGSSKGRLQRAAKSFLILMLSFEKLVTSKHMLMMLSATLRS